MNYANYLPRLGRGTAIGIVVASLLGGAAVILYASGAQPADVLRAEQAAKIELWREGQSPGKPGGTSGAAAQLPPEDSFDPSRGGGDTCAAATVIASLPFSDLGNTCVLADNYDEVCPFNAPGSPDAVYAFTAASTTTLDITLCANTAFDSKLYVYENVCGGFQSGSYVACNDDSCATPSYPSAYVSETLDVPVTSGNTYYIIVDGYSSDCGPFTLDVTSDAAPAGACCDADTGVCSNGVEEADCPAPLVFTSGVLCDDLDPACGAGACCDSASGICTNGVAPQDCAGPGVFFPGLACEDLDPPCGQGACCVGDMCSVQTVADCAALAGFFQGDGVDCGETDCAAISTNGVCCLAGGGCQASTPPGCASSGGTFHGYNATCADADLNGTADVCESDCNTNGVLDALDLARGNSVDCNFNELPDECEVRLGVGRDCNTNGVLDDCEPKDWPLDVGCLAGPGGGVGPGCGCSDFDSDSDVDLRDFAGYQAEFRHFGNVFISNGTGGGDWFDPGTWDGPGVPGSVRDYDVVQIVPGDVITQTSPTPKTLGAYLLEVGASHVVLAPADVAALSVEAYGNISTNGVNPGSVTIRNAAEVWTAGDILVHRVYDPNYCDLINNAPAPFDILGPCTPRSSEGGDDGGTRFDNVTTHRAITEIAADNNLCKLHDLLTKELLIKPGIDQTAADGVNLSYRDWIVFGSDNEDAPAIRVINHFLNPINNAGLTGFNNNAPTWAFDGNSAPAGGANAWDFVSGRGYHFQFLTEAQPATRAQFAARTFRSVGQILHLIEDMGSIAHTRNDKHPPGDSCPWEGHAAASFGTVAQMNGLPGVATGTGGAPPRNTLGHALPGFNRFMDWWDTGQYTGQAAFGGFGATPGLAEWANVNFFSKDTVFWFPDMPHPAVADTDLLTLFPPPANGQVEVPTATNLTGAGWVNVKQTAAGRVALNRLARARNIGVNRVRSWFSWVVGAPRRIEVSCNNPNVFNEYAQHVLPKTIAYCTDFINYFFRGKIDIRLRWNEAQAKYFLTITNKSGEAFGAGTWRLYQDDAAGVRAEVTADFSGFGGGLANNASFEASFQATQRRGRYMLVFQGTMGNEVNTAIAARAFDIVRVHITWDPKSDQDLYMRGPDGSLIAYFNLVTDFGELDNDDIGGDGPENITLKRLNVQGAYQFMINYYRDWWQERRLDPKTEACVDNAPPLNTPDDPGTACYTETTITITVKTYHNSSDPVREVTRTLSVPNFGAGVPGAGVPEGAAGNSWFVTQIVNVDADGVITVQGGN